MYDPVSFKTGIALACLSKGRKLAKREPVGFIYGTCEGSLPKLPERDLGILPYVTMYWHNISGKYIVYAHDEKWVRVMGETDYLHKPETPCRLLKLGELTPNTDTNWTKGSAEITEDWGNPGTTEFWNLSAFIPVWTNYDSLNEYGTVFFAASAPVPVYA
jgi:hypothetical protein